MACSSPRQAMPVPSTGRARQGTGRDSRQILRALRLRGRLHALNLLPRDAELKRIDMTAAGPHTSERWPYGKLVAEAGADDARAPPAAARGRSDRALMGAYSRARMQGPLRIIIVLAEPSSSPHRRPLPDDTRPDDQRISSGWTHAISPMWSPRGRGGPPFQTG